MSPIPFLSGLEPRIWKLLPLRDSHEKGKEVYLPKYVGSLTRELMGGLETYPELEESAYYVSIVNTMQYLNKYKTTHQEWRTEVLKMLNVQKKLCDEYMGGDAE